MLLIVLELLGLAVFAASGALVAGVAVLITVVIRGLALWRRWNAPTPR